MYSSNEKGAIAEAAIALRAAELGIRVLRPLLEGARYDLVFDVGHDLLRVQCKWATHRGAIVCVPAQGCYHSPVRGDVRSTYSAAEVDVIAAYCQQLNACYWLPIEKFGGQAQVHLRLRQAMNNQRAAVNMASEYDFGAVAQLEERRRGTPKATGSSPVSSISGVAQLGAEEYRSHLGHYMERAAAGERFLITRRGKPYARLSPPHEQLDLPAPEPAEVIPITMATARPP